MMTGEKLSERRSGNSWQKMLDDFTESGRMRMSFTPQAGGDRLLNPIFSYEVSSIEWFKGKLTKHLNQSERSSTLT